MKIMDVKRIKEMRMRKRGDRKEYCKKKEISKVGMDDRGQTQREKLKNKKIYIKTKWCRWRYWRIKERKKEGGKKRRKLERENDKQSK